MKLVRPLILLTLALAFSTTAIALTGLIRNKDRVPMKQKQFSKYYGQPFAFREQWVFMDSGGSNYSYKWFAINSTFVFVPTAIALALATRLKASPKDD